MVKIRILVLICFSKLVLSDNSVSSNDVESIDGVPMKQEVLGAIGEENTNLFPNENGGIPDNNYVPLPKPGASITYHRSSGKYITYYDNDYDPMISNVAPPPTDQRGGSGLPYTITEDRLDYIRSLFMYPFYNQGGGGDNDGDYQKQIQASTTIVHKNLNFQLPFFGFRYNYTRVSLNGYLEFSDPPPTYDKYPLTFPVPGWPKVNDPAFIGIFYSKCRMGKLRAEDYDKRNPGVYFRLERDLRDRKDQMGVEIRERVKWDIRQGVIGTDSFDPKHAIIVTWKNVSFAGGISDSLMRTNTFQMVLVTDEVFTYAIFNYLNLAWTTHTEARGDTTSGEGGTPAFVGFNGGNGTRKYEYKPYSQDMVIRDLTSTGFANGFPGRHIFRIDENILLGTCNKDIDAGRLDLMFAPESGNMLGGTIVNITGPCFEPKEKITCIFDIAPPVVGVVVNKNRAICIQPPLMAEGWVRFEIAVGNERFKWKGRYFVETPSMAAQKIFFSDMTYHDKSPAEIKISWENKNLTSNANANIRISLWGYRETLVSPQFVYITELATNVQNIGEYVIVPSQYRLNDNRFQQDITLGFIQINLTESIPVENTTVKITPLIWSRPIPLAWYFGPQWQRVYGDDWATVLCDNWIKDDRYLSNFAHELPQCPCTLQQALVDKGRYMPDFDCDRDSNPLCYYQENAIHCVRSGLPTNEGGEQQCCYDKNNFLMLSYDQIGGSNPRRSHNLGLNPYTESTKVPSLSQWYHDVIPKFVCCRWQDSQAVGCETFKFERRPTSDCTAYQGPAVAGVYGDPHIVTFDGLEYTFNGKGQFVLVKTNVASQRLEVHARFEQMPPNKFNEVKATQLTSIAVRGNASTIIEVRLRPKEARWRYRLDVIANKEKRLFFDRPSLKFQHFSGLTVYTPTYNLNQSEVIIMLDSGAGVEVVESMGFMSARVYLPWTFINKTLGLFGNWSFDITDDFTKPDGTKNPITVNINDMQNVYDNFGKLWMIDDSEDPTIGQSLFLNEYDRTAAFYNDLDFVPEFRMNIKDLIPTNISDYYIPLAYQACSNKDYQCLYDYAMTLDKDCAFFTTIFKSGLKEIREASKERTISCGILETPRFGWKSNFFFTPGSKVSFECAQDFVLDGDPRRECMLNGEWNVPVYGYTECLRQEEYSLRQAGLTYGYILAFLIPLLLLLVYFGYRFLQKISEENDQQNQEKLTMEQQQRLAQERAAKKLTAVDEDHDDVLSESTSSPRETTVY
ncbi:protein mesh isoform X3 [Harmonia axyridis]|uniref:protein mesh isoform X3 n=1 Tax=Harmonia axyridis TaxID=115357 RepID=UPI001E2753D9|nr:protein mesh isoform X3 [Harmonia axyridis]